MRARVGRTLHGMSWVTEEWGTAPVIFAGQGKKDHLRAAIQMLSGAVPRRTVYGHLGWRRIGDRWAFLHSGGAIGARWGDRRHRGRHREPTASSLISCPHRPVQVNSRLRYVPRLRFWSSDRHDHRAGSRRHLPRAAGRTEPGRLLPAPHRADRRLQDGARGAGPGALRRRVQQPAPARLVGGHRQHAGEEGVPRQGRGSGGR